VAPGRGGKEDAVHEGARAETTGAVPTSALASRRVAGPGWRSILGLLALGAILAVMAWVGGHALAERQRESIRASVTPYLQAVVDFRASELSRWLAERKGDAEVARRDPIIAAAAKIPAAERLSSPAFATARRRLEVIARSYGYESVTILDRASTPVLAWGQEVRLDNAHLGRALAAALTTGDVQFAPLTWLAGPAPGAVKLDVIAPLRFEAPSGAFELVGVLLLRIDVREIVAGVLTLPAAANPTGELTLIAGGDSPTLVLFPQRMAARQPWIVPQNGSAAQVEAALSAGRLNPVAAQTIDGTPSRATLVTFSQPVAGVPWLVLAREHIAELSGPSIRTLWLTCGLIATFLAGAGLAVYGLWKRRSERLLRANEEKFRNIFENMQDGYLLSDLAGTIRMVNPAAVRMLGYLDADELCGKSMPQDVFVDPDARAGLQKGLKTTGFVHGHKALFKRKDGSQVIVEGHVRLVRDHAGMPEGVEGVVRDMSSHYEIREELIRAREAAVSAAAIKTQFLANMSHEIRTPLNAIVGLGHLLERADLTPQLAGYVAKIQSSLRILLDVVNKVLDFSKIEAGRLTLEVIPFRLDDVLRGVENVVAVPARDKGLRLQFQVEDQVPPSLLGDPVRLGQVLTNLVDNGVKFTAAGAVSIKVAIVARTSDRVAVRFVVTDTGIGIAPDRTAAMFEPFVQADGSTTRRFGGTGLGLAISHQLVNAMGGQLSVASTPGAGSEFSFTLSLGYLADAARVPAPAPATLVSLRGVRILVAEDNAINQQVARELLEGVGAAVVIADNGAAAVETALAPGPAFDAILMDLQMPGMDGFEAAQAIRRDRNRGTLPIIAMTAHAFEQEKGKCLAAGMNDHVAKPVEPARLFATLLRWVRPVAIGADGSLAGIDVVTGLRRVGGNRALYDRLLGTFAQRWRDAGARIGEALGGPPLDEARRLAHTLKGTAATLGIDGISAQAADLEAALRSSAADTSDAPALTEIAPIEALRARLDAGLREICEVLDHAGFAAGPAPGPAPGADPTGERSVAQPVLLVIGELETLLMRRNLRAGEAVDRLRSRVLPDRCQGPLAQVVGKVARLEYAEAAVALAELKALLTPASIPQQESRP
jgi:PAS domain S-box-containing protein